MQRKIVISSLLNQVQVGIVEDGRLVEFYLERTLGERSVGNIYKGRVENVLPGMAAAFVDIGVGKNAFLYVADLPDRTKDQSVEDVLRVGESIVVQVAKESLGSKGPRVTANITLPGRYLVLLPLEEHLGISRQIVDEEERERLRAMAQEIRPSQMGLIVRTVAQGCSQEELDHDLHLLLSEWKRISSKGKKGSAPTLLYQDHDLVHRVLRDYLTMDVTKIIVDRPEFYKKVLDWVEAFGIRSQVMVEQYEGKVSLFDYFGLTKDLERAQKRRVWLDCGGYLVFDQTEALMSIDVNTGKYVGTNNIGDTVLKTNLQAAQEIAYQLRLRNIGGIIIIDFIDMQDEEDRDLVLQHLEKALAQDKTKTYVLGFTQLGLVELTRKKTKKVLSEVLDTVCPMCDGKGKVPSDGTIAFRVAQQVYYSALESDIEAVLVKCHPAVGAQLIGPGAANLDDLEKETGKTIYVRGIDNYERDCFQVISGKEDRIKAQAYPVSVGDRITAVIEGVHAHNDENGIVRVDGFVIDCSQCGNLVGKTVQLEITDVQRTYAVARLIKEEKS